MAINFSNNTPAAPSGSMNIAWQNDSSGNVSAYVNSSIIVFPVVIGFVIGSGTIGTNIGPMLIAPHAGSVSKCVIVTKASDSSIGLTFTIKQNGTSVFTSSPSVAAGTSSGTVSTFTTLTSVPLTITAGDVFSIDVTSGTSSWQFTAQLE